VQLTHACTRGSVSEITSRARRHPQQRIQRFKRTVQRHSADHESDCNKHPRRDQPRARVAFALQATDFVTCFKSSVGLHGIHQCRNTDGNTAEKQAGDRGNDRRHQTQPPLDDAWCCLWRRNGRSDADSKHGVHRNPAWRPASADRTCSAHHAICGHASFVDETQQRRPCVRTVLAAIAAREPVLRLARCGPTRCCGRFRHANRRC
jgi:hypothetical protein